MAKKPVTKPVPTVVMDTQKPVVSSAMETASGPKVRKLKQAGKRRMLGVLPPKRQPAGPGKTYKLPAAARILQHACRMLIGRWELFGGILLVYLIVNVILIGSGVISSGDLQSFKGELRDTFAGQFGNLDVGVTLFAFLVSSGNNLASGVSSAYQSVVLLITSLVLIYALRQTYAKNIVRVRDAYYGGVYPLVQSLLTLIMVGIHMVPAVLGGFLFTALIHNQIITVGWQQVIVGAVCFMLLVWSLFLLSASLFALYIITLPEMTPLKALRSAKQMVAGRRVMVLRKLFFLPLSIVLVAAVIMIPVSLFITVVAPPLLFVLTVLTVAVVHSYMYALYRELIASREVL